MKYRLTHLAQDDIRDILQYIRDVQQSPQNAMLVGERLRTMFRKLLEMPQLGHLRPELNDPDARVVAVSGVLVIYDPTLEPLTILRVIHGARDLTRIRHLR
jgi:antitoxin ParD1/3/4/toxin ParE1/3/4